MKHFNPGIDVQDVLKRQILDALHVDVVMAVRSHITANGGSLFESKSYREGNCFKIEKSTLPDLYRICQEVISALDFKEPVDFYLSGDSDINAHAWEADIEGETNLIEINSGLFNLMTEDELKFAIGHEIGHLINHDMLVRTNTQFVYPDNDTIPSYIATRLTLYDHIAELGADRYGYLANHNLEACVSALYKLASGIDLQKMKVSVPALIKENEQHLKFFMEENGEMFGDHPVNPLRVQALYTFSTGNSQEQINQCIYDIFNCISSKLFDDFAARFAFSAGLLMAQADGEVSERELALICERVGSDCIFPEENFNDYDSLDLNAIFEASISEMLDNYGLDARANMLRYVLKVMLADGTITEAEVELAYQMAEKMHLTANETADLIAEAMRSDYLPKITPSSDVLKKVNHKFRLNLFASKKRKA